MPVIIEKVFIGNIEGGTVIFGDVQNYSPKCNSSSENGQGSDNSGAFVVANNGISTNNS